jgi:hypothetical protein
MPVCRDCRHYRPGHFGPSGSAGKESMCALQIEGRDGPIPCARARRSDGDCGPDGLFFDDEVAA